MTSGTTAGVSINSTTKVLTISKTAVSDLASGSAVFKNYKSIVFKCEANETDANGTKICDYFTVAKLQDGTGISSVSIEYAQSSIGTQPPDTGWGPDVPSSISAGHFL